jgi:hypothetical protein
VKHAVVRITLLCGILAAQPPPAPSGAALAQAVSDIVLDPQQCYLVRDLSFARDDIKLYFNDGYLIFSKAAAGQRIAAVFAGTEDPADGELLLSPPRRDERQSLAKFTQTPNFDEHFRAALLTFTDGSAEKLITDILASGRSRVNEEAGRLLASEWSAPVRAITGSLAQRIVGDLISPEPVGGGFLFAALQSDRLGTFDIMFDPLNEDEIVAGQLSNRDGIVAYDVWTSFASRATRENLRHHDPPVVVSSYGITASLDQMLRLKAVTRETFTVGANPVRGISFGISRAEQITAARLDGQPAEVLFQESERTRALRANENDFFLVVTSALLAPGSVHQIEFEHAGDVIEDRGSGVYSVGARSNWYPRSSMEFATYDLEFRYPKTLTLVTAGEIVQDRTEGDVRITRRRPDSPIRVAGFNLGQFAHVSKTLNGITVDVYGNRGLDPALAPRPRPTIIYQPVRPLYRGQTGGTQASAIIQTPPAPDPLARMDSVASDVAASLQFFSAKFGPPSLKTLTVAPIPGTTGQGFPGLIYLSTLSYLDEAQRPQNAQNARLKTFFTDLMVAHEVAHQWWGNVVGIQGYQDEWIMEALAQYSALLWLEKKRGGDAFQTELANFRTELLDAADGKIIDSSGPLTWGYRLEGARNLEAYRIITYEKGAWVMHMLRRRMGDQRFFQMLTELRRRFQFKTLATHDLQDLVKEFASKPGTPADPPPTLADRIDSFFDSWVRSTGIPSVRVRYETSGRAPSVRVSGSIVYEQSSERGVFSDFETELPLDIQLANGMRRIQWVPSGERTEPFTFTLPQAPSRITLASPMTLATPR